MVDVKILRRNLLACLQEVTSSLRLFKVDNSGLQMIKDLFTAKGTNYIGLREVVKRGLFQNFPVDLKFETCSLQAPNMLTELCTEFLVGVVKSRFVIGKFCFKSGLSESNISLGWHVVFRCSCCLKNHG